MVRTFFFYVECNTKYDKYKLYIWDIEKNKLVKQMIHPFDQHHSFAFDISFSQDDNYICVSGSDSYIYNIVSYSIWNILCQGGK